MTGNEKARDKWVKESIMYEAGEACEAWDAATKRVLNILINIEYADCYDLDTIKVIRKEIIENENV